MIEFALFYVIFPLLIIPIFIKRILLFTFIWQSREYRFDRLFDYITLPESKPVLLDIWTKLRIFTGGLVIPGLAIRFIFNTSNGFFDMFLILLASAHFFENFHIFYKLLKQKPFLKPKFSVKALIVVITSSLITLGLIMIIFLLGVLEYVFILSPLIILFIPITVTLALGILWTPDYYLKKRIKHKARKKREELKNLKVVAISGSYGKSTTKEYVKHIFDGSFKTESTFKFQNTTLSCARKLLNLPENTDIFICELGSYKEGDGKEVCEFILPNALIITGINYQHIALFGSKDAIIRGESEGVHYLKQDEPVIINGDSELCMKVNLPAHTRSIWYGFTEGSNYRIKEIKKVSPQGTIFTLVIENIGIDLETNVLTKGNIQNLTAAIALAREFGIDWEIIKEKIRTLPHPDSTLTIINTPKGVVIDDSHNANPDGVINALEMFNYFEGKKILILDDVLELGKRTAVELSRIAENISKQSIDAIILCGRNYSTLTKELLIKKGVNEDIIIFQNLHPNKIGELIKEEQDSVCVLLEGYKTRDFLPYLTNLKDDQI